jgi:two-component system, chemotaxis family, chemotaxis protein CheY
MKTILIADDSKTTQMLVRTTLSRMPGLQFVAAENGRQALEMLDGAAVDLLVTDINMPEMDGIELVREVRRRKNSDELPILIMTAKGEDAARGEGMALGANAYILKPLSGRELIDKASKLLEKTP